MHIINISNCTLHIVKFFIGFDTLFWPIFVDFQNEAASVCIDNSTDKDVKLWRRLYEPFEAMEATS